ncbi:MAG: alpha/beta fold hydrolase [Candidatus Dormibacteria bacterium]
MFIDVRGRLVNALSFGAGDRTLLAHGGFAGNYELWLQPFETLSQKYRCVTYDHRGAGENVAEPGEISLEEMVEDLFGVMDALKLERPVVAAESMGVAVVLRAALDRPDRFAGMVLVDGSATWSREQSGPFVQGLKADYLGTLNLFIQGCIPEPGMDHVRRWGMHILTRSEQSAAVRLAECLWGVDLTGELAQLTVPTLVIHGSDDHIVPPAAGRLMAEHMGHSRLVVIQGAGHVPTMTFPGRVAEEIEAFMTSLPAGVSG